MILGMDPWVFTAWLGTILASFLCIIYGIYQEYVKPPKKKQKNIILKTTKRKETG